MCSADVSDPRLKFRKVKCKCASQCNEEKAFKGGKRFGARNCTHSRGWCVMIVVFLLWLASAMQFSSKVTDLTGGSPPRTNNDLISFSCQRKK